MQKSQPCREASASSAGAPQNARRQIGFSPLGATAENPLRGPQMRPRARRRTLVRMLRVPHPRWGLREAEGPEGRVVCHERLMALRRGVGPAGRGSSSGDAVDKKPGPLDVFTRGDGEGGGVMGEEGR